MKLKDLSLKDKGLFNKFLKLTRHELCVYTFENIYIWKKLFDIRWAVIENSLCVFFKDKMGCFLYLAPLAKTQNLQAIQKVFRALDRFNKNKDVSRIENIEEKEIAFYEKAGFICRNKSYDYLCLRSDLARLSGNKFKSKRASFNYFIKHYAFQYLPFSSKDRDGCLKLYDSWMRERQGKNQDHIYQAMLEDSRKSLKNALANYADLNFTGGLVRINKQIRAFTFGFKLNKDTFSILYEITDLSIKGLSQFVFSRFCQDLKGYKYINIMDDSGLENLQKVKLSYHPLRLVPAYIAERKNG
ncbi:MAG: phosphatidylglycerol lysyltransferase domain-containing protein [Candidatus Omnitrophica bacterium]|nr:phosphatidylglycerol lysyltransferase domain-containing protein [Candidatus Omnitrophota bacterium]MDD5592535.1 phosphatidylglycerol lysyltransferase domain-containing protein [Candidatus Omnitrophota bacterium]